MNKRILIMSCFLFSCADSNIYMTSNDIDPPASKEKTKNIKYTCNQGTILSVNFTSRSDNEGTLAIINGVGKQAIILSNKAVASGFLYSNGKYTLRGKGERATWTIGRMTPFQCSAGDKLLPQKTVK